MVMVAMVEGFFFFLLWCLILGYVLIRGVRGVVRF